MFKIPPNSKLGEFSGNLILKSAMGYTKPSSIMSLFKCSIAKSFIFISKPRSFKVSRNE